MSSGRDTLNSTQAAAAVTKAITVAAAVTSAQCQIDAAKSVVGYTLQTGDNVALRAAEKAAALAKANTLFSAEQARQAAVAVARDTLRNAGGDAGAF